MLAKFSYLAFGFVVGAGLLMALTMADHTTTLAKTSRVNGPVAPVNFEMERFG
ncbi:hypothetical protein [Pararhizobium sp. DWP1-1-3]|uniref:hypothetical protein n=1 Tax=Pararhizobium sp. DWP1-1-3 TaxID=2804652 RepID=UPI003CF553E5